MRIVELKFSQDVLNFIRYAQVLLFMTVILLWLTISDNNAIIVAGWVALHVKRQEVKLYYRVRGTYQPGALLVRRVVFRPSRGIKETRSLPCYNKSTTCT